MVRLLAKIIVAASVGAAVVATANGAGATGQGTLVIRYYQDFTTLDIQRDSTSGNQVPVPAWTDRLVGRGKNLQIVPYLATSWKITPTSVTFQLRKDAKCSDGSAITPAVVMASFKRYVSVPKIGSSQLGNQFGPGPYSFAINAKKSTFTFRVGTPFRNLLNGFASPAAGIVCGAGLGSDLSVWDSQVYGSGPYKLVSARHADQLVFQLRPEWHWGPPGTNVKTLPDQIVYKIVTNDTTAANLLLTGGVDVIAISGPDVARVQATGQFIHKTGQLYHAIPLAFNLTGNRVTLDKSVRQALMTAVDPKLIAQASGLGTPPGSILFPGMDCYSKADAKMLPTPSLDKARQILQQGGWTFAGGKWTKNGQTLRVKTVVRGDSPALGPSGEYIDKVFRDLGVDDDLQTIIGSGYGRTILALDWDVALVTFSGAIAPDPGINIGVLSGTLPPNGINTTTAGANDPAYQRLAGLAMGSVGKQSCNYFHQLMKRAFDNFYYLPTGAVTNEIFSRGWDLPPVDKFEVVWLTKKK